MLTNEDITAIVAVMCGSHYTTQKMSYCRRADVISVFCAITLEIVGKLCVFMRTFVVSITDATVTR